MSEEKPMTLPELQRRVEDTDRGEALHLEDGMLIRVPHHLFDLLQRPDTHDMAAPQSDEPKAEHE